MQQIIDAVKQEFPLYQPDTFKCGPDNTCIGCPKKLMELVDTGPPTGNTRIDRGIPPSFDGSSASARCSQEHPPGPGAQQPASPPDFAYTLITHGAALRTKGPGSRP